MWESVVGCALRDAEEAGRDMVVAERGWWWYGRKEGRAMGTATMDWRPAAEGEQGQVRASVTGP